MVAGPVSTAWLDLFEANWASGAESSLESYDSLDRLDAIPALTFLKELIWEEIRNWVANNKDPMTAVHHRDLDGPGHVFLGGMNHALNDDTLRAHDITAVISIHPRDLLAWHPTNASYGLRRFERPSSLGEGEGEGEGSPCPVRHHLMIPLEDRSNADLMDHLGETHDFLQSHLRAGRNVLVHCKSGRSRSVAVVIAYLQRKHYEAAVRPRDGDDGDDRNATATAAALADMTAYREAVTESIRQQRLPVSIIMERFEALLHIYDLQLLGHPAYAQERVDGFPEPPAAAAFGSGPAAGPLSPVTPLSPGGSQGMGLRLRPETMVSLSPAGRKRVMKRGGAAILKICTAVVFFRNGQKPPVPVVERLFEINDDYFYELEGAEHKGVSYRGSGHDHPGFCAFYSRFADEYGYEVPPAVALFSSEK